MLLTSLFGYMEWGGGNKAFLYESETEVFKGLGTDPASLIHPLVLLPLLGQLLLLITLFQHNPGKWLTYAGMISLSLLLGIILFIGILESNSRMLWCHNPNFHECPRCHLGPQLYAQELIFFVTFNQATIKKGPTNDAGKDLFH